MSTSDSNQVTAAKQDPPTARTSVEVAPPQRLEIHIPLITFLKVFAALLAGYAIYVLWPLLLLVLLLFVGVAGVAGAAMLGHGLENRIEDLGSTAFTAATGIDADAGILGVLGGWLSGD